MDKFRQVRISLESLYFSLSHKYFLMYNEIMKQPTLADYGISETDVERVATQVTAWNAYRQKSMLVPQIIWIVASIILIGAFVALFVMMDNAWLKVLALSMAILSPFVTSHVFSAHEKKIDEQKGSFINIALETQVNNYKRDREMHDHLYPAPPPTGDAVLAEYLRGKDET